MSQLVRTRSEFQSLAEARLAEARLLFQNGQWDGAYYLAGYAVELALKACIIKLLLATDAFPDKDLSRNCYTHDFEKLLRVAQLDSARAAAEANDPAFKASWFVVNEWSEERRYHRMDPKEAEGLLDAVSDPKTGVLPWLKTWW